jgi:di/tripeptidase
MTVSYVPSLKSARMQAVIDAIDSDVNPGFVQIGTAGMGTVLVAITLAQPSFSEDGEGTITMLGTPVSGSASAAGIAANATIMNGAGAEVVTGLTVALSNADIIISNVDIGQGDSVPIISGVIRHAP